MSRTQRFLKSAAIGAGFMATGVVVGGVFGMVGGFFYSAVIGGVSAALGGGVTGFLAGFGLIPALAGAGFGTLGALIAAPIAHREDEAWHGRTALAAGLVPLVAATSLAAVAMFNALAGKPATAPQPQAKPVTAAQGPASRAAFRLQ